MNKYAKFHPLFTDHGVDALGLGPWRMCHLGDLHELPASPGVYLYYNGSVYAEPHEEILYVGIAPETFLKRWREPEAFGRGGHHAVWRLWRSDPIEKVNGLPEETSVVYCELPGCQTESLERIEDCLIDLLAPALNRAKSPLHPYKAAVKYILQFTRERGWSPDPDAWPNDRVQAFYQSILDQATEFRITQTEQAPKLMDVVAGHWQYRACAPGFEFLPREWRRSMRDCPTETLRKCVQRKLQSLCAGERAELLSLRSFGVRSSHAHP